MVIQPLSRKHALLVVEIGNTTTTFAVFLRETLLDLFRVPTHSLGDPEWPKTELERLLDSYPEMEAAVLCSVVPAVTETITCLLRDFGIPDVLRISAGLKLPFMIQYDTPESFGSDRIALCAAGRKLFPTRSLIALDIGTAITVDVLTASGAYAGGFIMPGLDIMARSLHERTAQLPLVSVVNTGEFLGHSTDSCIRNGIFWGCIAGIDGLTEKIARQLAEQGDSEPGVILTGGNAHALAPFLKREAVHLEHAVARGACYLYEFNASPG